jgi:type III restriction enzyme
LAQKNPSSDPEGDLIEAHTAIAALGLVEAVKDYLDSEADGLAKKWLDQFRVQIKSLSDERQDVYRQLRAWSIDPQDIDIAKPTSWMQPTVAREINGAEIPLPTYEFHLLCDDDGLFPSEMNAWEVEVLNTEMQRHGFKAWYRNPARSSQDSLGIAYAIGTEHKIVRPDFIFFAELPDGSIAADIVDPHGTFLSDSLPKLRGMANYAEAHPGIFRRIESVAKFGDGLRVLDLTDPAVRAAIATASEVKALYMGPLSHPY